MNGNVFLSYSRNDREQAVALQKQLEQAGLTVFRDDAIPCSARWLNVLQEQVESCSRFVVLVGRDGVRRWMGAEASVALFRHIDPQRDEDRLPIFPILLGETPPDALPGFLRQFQAIRWNGSAPFKPADLERICEKPGFDGPGIGIDVPPFVGLDAFQPEQSRLFFGRQKETLELLDCLGRRRGAKAVRWLEIAGNSGCGKSSLMNAGLLPLIDEGWLCRKTGYEAWRRIGPLMPGDRPVEMLAEHLANPPDDEMTDVCKSLEGDDDRALARWLRGRKRKNSDGIDAAFLLAIDQFEELFTVSEADQRRRFDRLLAAALEDLDCPLFVVSTIRADFLDRFEDMLPRLMAALYSVGEVKILPPIEGDGLRQVIEGPARLADLDVSEVRDWILSEARGETGALPLVENALRWLWEQRVEKHIDNGKTRAALSGDALREAGGIAGILSSGADELLDELGSEERDQALRLLFRLVRIDPEGRHTRRRLSFDRAVEVAGGGESGRTLVHALAGTQVRDGSKSHGSVRLITITGGTDAGRVAHDDRSVNLIHETLIRARSSAGSADAQPYWPTLWRYIDTHKGQSFRVERIASLSDWIETEAKSWDAAGRRESGRWLEPSVLSAMREIRDAGERFKDVIRSDLARTFIGPTDPDELVDLLGFAEADDPVRGGGRYGERWRLPLGHEGRAAVAERLAIVGDPRRGVDLVDGLPDIEWVPIDGGDVTIEKTRHKVAPFRMAKYPITIAQFKAFAHECFRDGKWCLLSESEDKFPHEDPPTHRAVSGSHGADGVSWYDARAFCDWLGARLQLDIRLPTEAEWQLAATAGDPERIYPWGPDWDPQLEPWRANTAESRLGRTLPVGFYPLGASADGVMDMAGNLWEWCQDWYDQNKGSRVLRGGSWDDLQGYARSAYRDWLLPSNRNDFFGFRVVCSSPSTEH